MENQNQRRLSALEKLVNSVEGGQAGLARAITPYMGERTVTRQRINNWLRNGGVPAKHVFDIERWASEHHIQITAHELMGIDV